MNDLPCLKPACYLIMCCSMVGAILQYHSSVEFVHVKHEGYGRLLFGIAVFPRLPHGDILGLFPYGWDLIFH